MAMVLALAASEAHLLGHERHMRRRGEAAVGGFLLYSLKLVKSGKVSYDAGKAITSPALAAEAARKYYGSPDREIVSVLLLDARNRIIGANLVSVGTLDKSIVDPREVFKAAILANAAAILIIHNHPSGDPSPSRDDVVLTARLVEAGKFLGIRVLDHIILGEGTYASLKEAGLVAFEP